MRILIADDDPIQRHAMRTQLGKWKYEPLVFNDGRQAWQALQEPNAPALAIFDWNMPGMDGVDLCREIRSLPSLAGMYIILLTGNLEQKDKIAGLESGADDYITKPFHWDELRARLRAGERIVNLQQALAARVEELQEALVNVKKLSGLLPICAYCKRIRDNQDYWTQVEKYLAENSEAQFSHGVCPDCLNKHLAMK